MKAAGLFFLTLLLATPFPTACRAATGEWSNGDHLKARMEVEKTPPGKDGGNMAGVLEIMPDEGWHIYWRMAGDAGLPPEFNFDLSGNVDNVAFKWPAPERVTIFDLHSFGYHGDTLFPLDISLKKPDEKTTLKAGLKIMVCKDICIPAQLDTSVTFDPATEIAPADSRYKEAMSHVPATGDSPVLKMEQVVIGTNAIVINAYSKNRFKQADAFFESDDVYISAKPEIIPDEKDDRHAMIKLPAPDDIKDLAKALIGKSVTLTLTDGPYAMERKYDF